MSKNPTVAKSILPLVYSAIRKRKLYPSSADDKGTHRRNATYLTQIVLNLLNGADECSDQMAASAVYNLGSYMSSHSFVNLYVVDFLKYVKSGGKSLSDEVTHASDIDNEQKMKLGNHLKQMFHFMVFLTRDMANNLDLPSRDYQKKKVVLFTWQLLRTLRTIFIEVKI